MSLGLVPSDTEAMGNGNAGDSDHEVLSLASKGKCSWFAATKSASDDLATSYERADVGNRESGPISKLVILWSPT
jgi:hypothetical protein